MECEPVCRLLLGLHARTNTLIMYSSSISPFDSVFPRTPLSCSIPNDFSAALQDTALLYKWCRCAGKLHIFSSSRWSLMALKSKQGFRGQGGLSRKRTEIHWMWSLNAGPSAMKLHLRSRRKKERQCRQQKRKNKSWLNKKKKKKRI